MAIQTNRPNSRLIIVSAIAGAAALSAFAALYAFGALGLPLTPDYVNPKHVYVIYYGHLVDNNGQATWQTEEMLQSQAELVVVPYSFPDGQQNLTPEVQRMFEDQGIRVITYTWTNYTERNLQDVLAEIDMQMSSGVDGIFVDEVTNIENDAEFDYYSAIYHHVKQYGEDTTVIMNPGHYQVSERVMAISDIMSLEAEWTFADRIQWLEKYPPSMLMGVSSNEYAGDSQGIQDSDSAKEQTLAAWDSGIGYHFSTDMYIDLPPWFADYVAKANNEKIVEKSE